MISEVISGIFTLFHNLQSHIWGEVELLETNFDGGVTAATIAVIQS